MKSFSWKRGVAYVISVGLLGVTAWFGKEGAGDFGESATLGQKVCSVAVVVYGVTAVVALLGLFLRKRWAIPATIAWTAAMVVAGTLAPTVWGDIKPAWWVTLLSAVTVAAIGAGVTALVRYLVTSTREATSRT